MIYLQAWCNTSHYCIFYCTWPLQYSILLSIIQRFWAVITDRKMGKYRNYCWNWKETVYYCTLAQEPISVSFNLASHHLILILSAHHSIILVININQDTLMLSGWDKKRKKKALYLFIPLSCHQ